MKLDTYLDTFQSFELYGNSKYNLQCLDSNWLLFMGLYNPIRIGEYRVCENLTGIGEPI